MEHAAVHRRRAQTQHPYRQPCMPSTQNLLGRARGPWRAVVAQHPFRQAEEFVNEASGDWQPLDGWRGEWGMKNSCDNPRLLRPDRYWAPHQILGPSS